MLQNQIQSGQTGGGVTQSGQLGNTRCQFCVIHSSEGVC